MAGAFAQERAAPNAAALAGRIVKAVRLTLFMALCAATLLLVIRRFNGAFQQPLSGWGLACVTLALELIALFVRWPMVGRAVPTMRNYGFIGGHSPLYATGTQYSVLSRLFVAGPAVLGVLLLGSLSISGTRIPAMATAWFLFAACEAAMLYLNFSPSGLARQPAAYEEVEASERVPEGLVQQLTRVRQDDAESIHALVTARFEARDSLTVVHLAFYPPLNGSPTLTGHAIDADDLEVRVTQAESFGARIEVRQRQTTFSERTATIEVIGSAAIS